MTFDGQPGPLAIEKRDDRVAVSMTLMMRVMAMIQSNMRLRKNMKSWNIPKAPDQDLSF